ncbi:MAG: hypothetical protein JRH20_14780 [Deltaproteobacteria bacterium]|nr:hypothetical protein [Deltaproteobacteria bacterium]
MISRVACLVVATVSLLPAGDANARKPKLVAVFDLNDRGVGLSPSMVQRLSEYLSLQLASTAVYQVVPRDQLKKRLSQQKVDSYRACYSQSCQIEIGKELAAQKTLATTLMKLGGVCTVTAVVFDLRKAASEGGASVEGTCSEDGIVASIKHLVKKLAIGEAASKEAASKEAASKEAASKEAASKEAVSKEAVSKEAVELAAQAPLVPVEKSTSVIRPSTRRWFFNAAFGPSIALDGMETLYKISQEIGFHFSGGSGLGLALVTAQILDGEFKTFEGYSTEMRLFWDIEVASMGLYVSPLAQVGVCIVKWDEGDDGAREESGFTAVELLLGMDLKIVLGDRALLFVRAIGLDLLIYDGETHFRYDLTFGLGVAF